MEEALVVLCVGGFLAFLWLLRLTVAVAEQRDAQEAAEQAAERRYGTALQEFGKVYQSLITLTEEVEKLEERIADLKDEVAFNADMEQDLIDRIELLEGDYEDRAEDLRPSEGRREERCLTGQCDPVGCEREQCPHRTAEWPQKKFQGVFAETTQEELEVILGQQGIDLADPKFSAEEPAKQDDPTPNKGSV